MYSILFTGDKAAPDKGVWCWCRDEEHGEILMCKGPNCQVQWFQNVFFFGFAWDYCTAQCFLSIDQTILLGVNSLMFQLSVNDQSHIKIRVVMTKGRLTIAFAF